MLKRHISAFVPMHHQGEARLDTQFTDPVVWQRGRVGSGGVHHKDVALVHPLRSAHSGLCISVCGIALRNNANTPPWLRVPSTHTRTASAPNLQGIHSSSSDVSRDFCGSLCAAHDRDQCLELDLAYLGVDQEVAEGPVLDVDVAHHCRCTGLPCVNITRVCFVYAE